MGVFQAFQISSRGWDGAAVIVVLLRPPTTQIDSVELRRLSCMSAGNGCRIDKSTARCGMTSIPYYAPREINNYPQMLWLLLTQSFLGGDRTPTPPVSQLQLRGNQALLLLHLLLDCFW